MAAGEGTTQDRPPAAARATAVARGVTRATAGVTPASRRARRPGARRAAQSAAATSNQKRAPAPGALSTAARRRAPARCPARSPAPVPRPRGASRSPARTGRTRAAGGRAAMPGPVSHTEKRTPAPPRSRAQRHPSAGRRELERVAQQVAERLQQPLGVGEDRRQRTVRGGGGAASRRAPPPAARTARARAPPPRAGQRRAVHRQAPRLDRRHVQQVADDAAPSIRSRCAPRRPARAACAASGGRASADAHMRIVASGLRRSCDDHAQHHVARGAGAARGVHQHAARSAAWRTARAAPTAAHRALHQVVLRAGAHRAHRQRLVVQPREHDDRRVGAAARICATVLSPRASGSDRSSRITSAGASASAARASRRRSTRAPRRAAAAAVVVLGVHAVDVRPPPRPAVRASGSASPGLSSTRSTASVVARGVGARSAVGTGRIDHRAQNYHHRAHRREVLVQVDRLGDVAVACSA